MSRTKGSKNKPKIKTKTNTLDASPAPAPEPPHASEDDAVAVNDDEELDCHKAEPALVPAIKETVPEMTSRLCHLISEREDERAAKAADAKRHQQLIDSYDTDIASLARSIEEAD